MIVNELTVLALAIFSVCSANPSFGGRILGGQDAIAGQFPHQVSLRRQGSHICGGSIVNENYILTAAHCVVQLDIVPYPASYFSIRAGSIYREKEGVLRNVKKVTVHPDYKNFLNDFAVLLLSEPLTYSDDIKNIKLCTTEIPDGSNVTISGWGKTQNQNSTLPDILQWNISVALSRSKCTERTGTDSPALLCLAHAQNNGACNGDSGGPAIFQNELIGCATFVINGCGSTYPDGYAKVSHNIDWILANTK